MLSHIENDSGKESQINNLLSVDVIKTRL
jgi:hypothetical protein